MNLMKINLKKIISGLCVFLISIIIGWIIISLIFPPYGETKINLEEGELVHNRYLIRQSSTNYEVIEIYNITKFFSSADESCTKKKYNGLNEKTLSAVCRKALLRNTPVESVDRQNIIKEPKFNLTLV